MLRQAGMVNACSKAVCLSVSSVPGKPAEAAGKFSSPELTLCADSGLVSIPPQHYHSGT